MVQRILEAGDIESLDHSAIPRIRTPERLAVFARAHALSPRESVLLGHLAKGGDSHALAGRMCLSEHTVQDHLKSIFAKTSTNNRGMLLARALGA